LGLRKRKEITFFVILAVAVLLTIGFTIVYIQRALHPVVLIREEAYIYYDGTNQIVTGFYNLENRLPMNIVTSVDYSFPVDGDLGDPVIEIINLETPFGTQVLDYKFINREVMALELRLPPFGGGKLTVQYRQPVLGDKLSYFSKSANSWGPAAKKGALFFKLEQGYDIPQSSGDRWFPAEGVEWDYTMVLPRKPEAEINIEFVKLEGTIWQSGS
jgi:hypothetical protein